MKLKTLIFKTTLLKREQGCVNAINQLFGF